MPQSMLLALWEVRGLCFSFCAVSMLRYLSCWVESQEMGPRLCLAQQTPECSWSRPTPGLGSHLHMWCSMVWTGPRLSPSQEQHLQVLASLVCLGSLCKMGGQPAWEDG